MSINVSARKYHLLVGGEDYSAAMLEAKLDTTELSQSGFVTTTGSITLISVQGLPGSLDDRVNSDWRVGQTVTIDVTNESGVLDRHPVGAMRIISAEYSYEDRRLTLRVGCLLTLLSFKHPTEPLEGQDTEVISFSAKNNYPTDNGGYGSESKDFLNRSDNYFQASPINGSSRLGIVTALLNRAGISNINCPYNIPNAIAYPIEPSGSYVETAGKILYSAGYVAWVDRHETIQIKPVTLRGTARITLQIGGDKGDELWYRRLSNSEGIREIIKVSGMKKLAQHPTDFYTVSTKYGSAKTVDPISTNITVAVEVKEIEQKINENIVTTITTISRPAGLVIPSTQSGKFNLIIAERTAETKEYDTRKNGKLRSIRTNTFRPIGAVLAEYFKYLEDNGNDPGSKGRVILSGITESYYQYDNKERPTKIDTIKYETLGALLSGINQDWGEITSTPSGLKIASTQQESWSFLYGSTWRHTINSYSTLSKLKPELIVDDAPKESKLQLLSDDNASIDESSSSGQTVPPAPERRPEKVVFVDKRVEGQAQFSQYGGNPLKERERTYSIEYLESGVYDASTDLGYIQNFGVGVGNDPQCAAIAALEGQLLFGRFKGQDLGINLKDELFVWEPLMAADCIEPDGTQRAFCLDDAHWYLGEARAMVNFGCIWIGSRTNQTRIVFVVVRLRASPQDTTIFTLPVSGYIPAGTVLNFGGVEVVTRKVVQAGDTEVEVVNIPALISHGVNGTYTEMLLRSPYIIVQQSSARSSTVADSRAYPYALSTVELGAQISSIASAYAVGGYGLEWDTVSVDNWNDMDNRYWSIVN